jgi:acyl-[acyl-carrier-protein]-phospholipid O-acyltransferase/long-chain-fatty-acid--[acyl-carrier-protein] ligase
LAELPPAVTWAFLALVAVLLILLGRRSDALLRACLWLLTHTAYRLRVRGIDRVPVRGPALLVCNPVSYFDWLLLYVAPRRRVRLVVLAGWVRRPFLRRLLNWTQAFAVDDGLGARGVVRALRDGRRALARGEVVVLFAESYATKSGLNLPFHRAFARVARDCNAPVIPVCVDQPYGSLFSIYAGRFLRKPPPVIPYPVTVTFGEPLPCGVDAATVRQSVLRLSADHALSEAPRRLPVHRQFLRMAARHPFRPCLIDSTPPDGRTINYARTLAGGLLMARLLRPLVADDDHVGLWLPPSIGGGIANIALAFLGKTSVNLNYSSSPAVVQAALRQAGVRVVLTSKRFVARMKFDGGLGVQAVYLEDLQPLVPKWRQIATYLAVVVLPGWVLERWAIRGRGHGPDDVATVVFSSGSTGEPKGVVLTHANVAANAGSIAQATGAGPSDRILGVLPFFHSFGYTVTLWTPLQVGASSVFHPDPRQAKEIGELCRKHRCTIYLSTATFLRFCLKKCDPGDFASLHILVCGAEKLPPSLAKEFEARFGVLPLEGYGCTELSPAAAFSLPDVEVDGFRQVHQRSGSIGVVMPGAVGRIVHPETFAPLPAGEEGLLLIRGANVMRGYLDRPDLTGDVGRIDADGFVWLTGRLSRFAKCGGEMVPLERIEEVLHDILGTSERVCGVTCIPDEARGERLSVLYVPNLLEAHALDVRSWAQQLGGRGLPNLWVPSERDFHPVAEIPVLGSGKVDLKRLKDIALELASHR